MDFLIEQLNNEAKELAEEAQKEPRNPSAVVLALLALERRLTWLGQLEERRRR